MFANRKRPPLVQPAQLSTLVAEGVEITGNVAFGGGMRIDGRVIGDVTGRTQAGMDASLLVLSATGYIEGAVRCADAVVNGSITGDLDVEHRLELQSDARVRGTIRYRQLQMDVGATVHGELVRIEADAGTVGGNVVELGADKIAAVAERR